MGMQVGSTEDYFQQTSMLPLIEKEEPTQYGNLITAGNISLANKAASLNIKEKLN